MQHHTTYLPNHNKNDNKHCYVYIEYFIYIYTKIIQQKKKINEKLHNQTNSIHHIHIM